MLRKSQTVIPACPESAVLFSEYRFPTCLPAGRRASLGGMTDRDDIDVTVGKALRVEDPS